MKITSRILRYFSSSPHKGTFFNLYRDVFVLKDNSTYLIGWQSLLLLKSNLGYPTIVSNIQMLHFKRDFSTIAGCGMHNKSTVSDAAPKTEGSEAILKGKRLLSKVQRVPGGPYYP